VSESVKAAKAKESVFISDCKNYYCTAHTDILFIFGKFRKKTENNNVKFFAVLSI